MPMLYDDTSDVEVRLNSNCCVQFCLYAKQCFAENKDMSIALAELHKHCDNCIFSSMEED